MADGKRKDARRLGKGRAAHEDLTGRRFGRLAVLGPAPKKSGNKQLRWRWACDCGKEGVSPGNNLRSGKAQSCGCRQREEAARQAVVTGHANRRHGMTGTAEWLAWKNMLARCYDSGQQSYPHYGGRGVTVHERWRVFENFHADMGDRPSAEHSLDRFPNPAGAYEPGNCRWATHKEQQRNRRSHKPLTHDGRTQCLSAWAEERGLTKHRLWRRLSYGWPVGLAIETPVGVLPPELDLVRLPVDPLVRLKARAHAAVYRAVKDGRLARPPHCQRPGCAASPVEAHHHRGYAKNHFLDVAWLCRRHHEEAERTPAVLPQDGA